jgi:hypothetical protein
MKPRDIFSIILKAIGLIAVLYGFADILDGLLLQVGLGHLERTTPKYWLVRGIVHVVIGLFLMRGFPPLVDIAYPQEPESGQTPTEKPKDDA